MLLSRRSFLAAMPACAARTQSAGCALPESAAGYRAAGLPPGVHVVPAVSHIGTGALRRMKRFVHSGGILLFESGAAFASEDVHAEQRRLLRAHFGIEIGNAIELWKDGARVPYVEYMWPMRVHVRDFSRAIPVTFVERGQVIASLGAVPVAAARNIGDGTFVFLGSPLGPLLHAGDADARRWLASVGQALTARPS